MIDFLIVGDGLAANILALKLQEYGYRYHIIGAPNLSACSRIAAGIWNPVVFKRMTKSWLADELIPELKMFYNHWEQKTGTKFYTEREIIKPFFSEEEKKHWIKKSNTDLHHYLSDKIYEADTKLNNMVIPGFYGKVKHSGNLNMSQFFNMCKEVHKSTSSISDAVFNYEELQVTNEKIKYRHWEAKNIVFCEGYLVKNNPFFNWIPMLPVKGEILELHSEHIHLNVDIFNRNGFLLPNIKHNFVCGATYNWQELNDEPSEKGKQELQEKLQAITRAPYQVIAHKAGVRPSVKDRRPIIGNHPAYSNVFIFNGLGTKGVMLAPYFVQNFVLCYQQKVKIQPETNISRFYSLYHEQNG